jgi:hypothetical protein
MLQLLIPLVCVALLPAPQRDHLTPQEAELVRETQRIDGRVKLYLKFAERRLLVLVNPAAVASQDDLERYGPLPKGSPAELLDNYRRTIEELMDKLDYAYEEGGQAAEVKRALAASHREVARQTSLLESLRPRFTSEAERMAFDHAMESANALRSGARAASLLE